MKICGIYYIFNFATCKVYVGSSIDVEKRIRGHFNQLKRNHHSNCFMQRAFNSHYEYFRSGLIEECNSCDLLKREEIAIELFQSRDDCFGYNLQDAIRDDSGNRWNKEVLKKMSDSRKRFFDKNPLVLDSQIKRLSEFWVDNWKRPWSMKRRKLRCFQREDTGEVFNCSIPDLIRAFPELRLDKGALQRVSSGKNRMHKKFIKC